MKKVLLLLAKGSEELEAISVINLLRRAKLNCTIAAVDGHCEKDGLVTCSQGTRILADTLLSQTDPKSFDALVLPGGMEGAKTFSKVNQPKYYFRMCVCKESSRKCMPVKN